MATNACTLKGHQRGFIDSCTPPTHSVILLKKTRYTRDKFRPIPYGARGYVDADTLVILPFLICFNLPSFCLTNFCAESNNLRAAKSELLWNRGG